MTIDPDAETLIHFSKATRAIPGKPVCLQTLHRWRLRGVRGAKLETIVVGGLRYTSAEAISRFIAAQNALEGTSPSAVEAGKKQRAEAADSELKRMLNRSNAENKRPSKSRKTSPNIK